METPKYCLEAVGFWDHSFKKGPRKYGGAVKVFCAYGALDYGTDNETIKEADRGIMDAMRAAEIISRAFTAAQN